MTNIFSKRKLLARKASLLRLDRQFFSFLTSATRSLVIQEFNQDRGDAIVTLRSRLELCHSKSSREVQKQCSEASEESLWVVDPLRVLTKVTEGLIPYLTDCKVER